jgi:hypothetical protein
VWIEKAENRWTRRSMVVARWLLRSLRREEERVTEREGGEGEREERRRQGGLIHSSRRQSSSGTSTARRWHPAAMKQTRSCFSSWRKTMRR